MSGQTIYVTIGNSDDGLTQAEWAEFYRAVDHAVRSYAETVYGAWVSPSTSEFQNACWAFAPTTGFGEDGTSTPSLRQRLSRLAAQYRQQSIAWVSGPPEFIGPPS